MNFDQILTIVSISLIPVIFAITLHEAAHGWVADKLGDPTARSLGRITANPFKHIDLVGTVIVPFIMVTLSGVVFGWAKPVPVDARNFKRPVKHMAIVAAAGPVSNLLMALFWAVLLSIVVNWIEPDNWLKSPLGLVCHVGIFINVILMTLNLLPLLPLDGGRVVAGFLSPEAASRFMKMEPYGLIILLLLLFTGILGKILIPVVSQILSVIYSLFGLEHLLPVLKQLLGY